MSVFLGMTLRNATKHTWADAATGLTFPPGEDVTIPQDVHKTDDLRVGDFLESLKTAVKCGILEVTKE